jgi:hypothetical protein
MISRPGLRIFNPSASRREPRDGLRNDHVRSAEQPIRAACQPTPTGGESHVVESIGPPITRAQATSSTTPVRRRYSENATKDEHS